MSADSLCRASRLACPVARVVCLILSLLVWGAYAETTTPRKVAEPMESLSAGAFWWADFDELERLYALASVPGSRTPDGRVLMAAFRYGLWRVFDSDNNDSAAYYAQLEALTREWSTQRPTSSLAQALHARALLANGLHSRGGDYASKVTPQEWAGLEKYLQMALAHLAAHPEVIAEDSSANLYLLLIGRWKGWPIEKLAAIAAHGQTLAPDDSSFDEEMVVSLLPKWGGSAQAIDRYVSAAMVRAGPERSAELYARLYLVVASDFKGALFTDSRADWGRMKQGFRDMLSRYPDPINFNQFARVACIAQDKEAVRSALDVIGKSPDFRRWGGGWSGRRNYESCAAWARSS